MKIANNQYCNQSIFLSCIVLLLLQGNDNNSNAFTSNVAISSSRSRVVVLPTRTTHDMMTDTSANTLRSRQRIKRNSSALHLFNNSRPSERRTKNMLSSLFEPIRNFFARYFSFGNVYKRFMKYIMSIGLALSLTFAGGSAFSKVQPAQANDGIVKPPPTVKIRPGMKRSDIDTLVSKDPKGVGFDLSGETRVLNKDLGSRASSSSTEDELEAALAKSKQKEVERQKEVEEMYGDDSFDEDYDDFDLDDDSEGNSAAGGPPGSGKQKEAPGLSTRTTYDVYDSSKVSKNKKNLPIMYIKAALVVGLPIVGVVFVGETWRDMMEQAQVRKAIEITDAQNAEYFNVTKDGKPIGGNATDEELAEELEGLKNNETDTDDDDDIEDDDDDIDEDAPPPPPTKPKRPRPDLGPMGGGDMGGSDDSGPSQNDLDKLNSMFKKS